MSTASYDAIPAQGDTSTDPTAKIKQRIQQARQDRKRFEPTWLSNLAFTAGKHYHVFDRYSRTMMLPPELEADVARGNLYTADVITERRMRALGELSAEDDRPELLLVDDGPAAEDFQTQLNKAVGYAWDYEAHGDEALLDVDQKTIDLGTAAIRVRFDTQTGQVKGQAPYVNGKPILDPSEAIQHVAGMAEQGQTADIRDIREGRIRWEVLSPFNLLVPPGVEHEKDFPWEVVVRPVPLDEVKAQYGQPAAGLVEDTDIGSIMGLDTKSGNTQGYGNNTTDGQSNTATARLRDHVWVFTYYERPTARFEQGRMMVFASNEMKLLTPDPQALPYCAPDGTYRSGITYFHWWRVTGRFWSRALVEPMKDVQRRINKRTNQIDQTIDRGQPFVIVDKNGNAHKRRGFPVEIIALEPTERQPIISSGIQPGSWMYQDKEDAISDLERASGIGASALGENPQNVDTYSQLALLNEQEASKRTIIRKGRANSIERIVEDTVHDIRTYWGPDKQVLFDSDDDRVQARVFDATKTPTFFVVRTAKGSSKPRSQAAELQKVNDVWNAILGSTAIQSDPQRWVTWYRESLDAGQVLEFPEQPNDSQTDKAELENHLLNTGQLVEPAYYDQPQVHVPIHRDAQIEADMAGDNQAVAMLEQHIQMHLQMAQQVAEQQAAAEAPALAQQTAIQMANTQAQTIASQPPQPPEPPVKGKQAGA